MEILKKVVEGRRARTEDVVITVSMSKTVMITLTEDARNKLYSDRIYFGLEKDRLYFFESDDDNGYKISKHKSRNLWCVSGGKTLANKLYKYRGRYDFEYDAQKKAYYITLAEKER